MQKSKRGLQLTISARAGATAPATVKVRAAAKRA
jgi:hypothetical protein